MGGEGLLWLELLWLELPAPPAPLRGGRARTRRGGMPARADAVACRLERPRCSAHLVDGPEVHVDDGQFA